MIILGIWGFTPAFAPVEDVSQSLAENVIGAVCAFALLIAPAAIITAIKAIIPTAKPAD